MGFILELLGVAREGFEQRRQSRNISQSRIPAGVPSGTVLKYRFHYYLGMVRPIAQDALSSKGSLLYKQIQEEGSHLSSPRGHRRKLQGRIGGGCSGRLACIPHGSGP